MGLGERQWDLDTKQSRRAHSECSDHRPLQRKFHHPLKVTENKL